MITQSPAVVWTILIALGIGTYALRFSFLGLLAGRRMPEWVQRHLRYVVVAVIPGIVCPLVLYPDATGGILDIPRLVAAFVTIGAGIVSRSFAISILCGVVALYSMLYLGA